MPDCSELDALPDVGLLMIVLRKLGIINTVQVRLNNMDSMFSTQLQLLHDHGVLEIEHFTGLLSGEESDGHLRSGPSFRISSTVVPDQVQAPPLLHPLPKKDCFYLVHLDSLGGDPCTSSEGGDSNEIDIAVMPGFAWSRYSFSQLRKAMPRVATAWGDSVMSLGHEPSAVEILCSLLAFALKTTANNLTRGGYSFPFQEIHSIKVAGGDSAMADSQVDCVLANLQSAKRLLRNEKKRLLRNGPLPLPDLLPRFGPEAPHQLPSATRGNSDMAGVCMGDMATPDDGCDGHGNASVNISTGSEKDRSALQERLDCLFNKAGSAAARSSWGLLGLFKRLCCWKCYCSWAMRHCCDLQPGKQIFYMVGIVFYAGVIPYFAFSGVLVTIAVHTGDGIVLWREGQNAILWTPAHLATPNYNYSSTIAVTNGGTVQPLCTLEGTGYMYSHGQPLVPFNSSQGILWTRPFQTYNGLLSFPSAEAVFYRPSAKLERILGNHALPQSTFDQDDDLTGLASHPCSTCDSGPVGGRLCALCAFCKAEKAAGENKAGLCRTCWQKPLCLANCDSSDLSDRVVSPSACLQSDGEGFCQQCDRALADNPPDSNEDSSTFFTQSNLHSFNLGVIMTGDTSLMNVSSGVDFRGVVYASKNGLLLFNKTRQSIIGADVCISPSGRVSISTGT